MDLYIDMAATIGDEDDGDDGNTEIWASYGIVHLVEHGGSTMRDIEVMDDYDHSEDHGKLRRVSPAKLLWSHNECGPMDPVELSLDAWEDDVDPDDDDPLGTLLFVFPAPGHYDVLTEGGDTSNALFRFQVVNTNLGTACPKSVPGPVPLPCAEAAADALATCLADCLASPGLCGTVDEALELPSAVEERLADLSSLLGCVAIQPQVPPEVVDPTACAGGLAAG